MRKMISILLVLVIIAVPLIGCHGAVQHDVFEMPESFDTSRDYEITFWAKNDSNVTQINVYKKAIADFEAIYPNIKVTLVPYTDYGEIYNDVITNIATNTTPNVCITYPDHIATYLTNENCVVALDELMNDKNYGLGGSQLRFDGVTKTQIVSKFLEEGRLNSKQYALPFMRSTEACYVNKTLVEALGFTLPEKLTWDFVWQVSEKAMSLGKTTVTDEKGKNTDVYVANGQKTLIPFIYKSTDNMMITMLKQLNAGYSTGAGHVEIFNDTTVELLQTIGQHGQSRAFSTFKISGYPANYFNAGQCIFMVDSTAGATWVGCDAPLMQIPEDSVVEFETVVMEVPQFDQQNTKMISQGPSICIFNKTDTQEVLASWLFAQFLLTNEVQITYSQTEGYVPVTTKAQNSKQYQDYLSRAGEDNELYYSVKLNAAKLLLDNTENTFVTPVFNGSASLRSAAQQLIEETVKTARQRETVDETYLQQMFEKIKTLYHLDEIETGGAKNDLGPLPREAIILIVVLGVAWAGIATAAWCGWKKKRKNQ